MAIFVAALSIGAGSLTCQALPLAPEPAGSFNKLNQFSWSPTNTIVMAMVTAISTDIGTVIAIITGMDHTSIGMADGGPSATRDMGTK